MIVKLRGLEIWFWKIEAIIMNIPVKIGIYLELSKYNRLSLLVCQYYLINFYQLSCTVLLP